MDFIVPTVGNGKQGFNMEEWKGEACKLCNDECKGYDELEFVSKDWHMCKLKGIIWQVKEEEKEAT